MDGSLSIILPVRNVEHQLAFSVHELVEVVAELSTEMEVLIVDDGSTDNTEEVVTELACLYPQVITLRHSVSQGATQAAQLGVQHSHGDFILIHNIEFPLSHEAVRKLWAMRDDEELVIASSKSPRREAEDQSSWMEVGTKLLRRKAVDDLRPSFDTAAIINRVTRTDLRTKPMAPLAMPAATVVRSAPE